MGETKVEVLGADERTFALQDPSAVLECWGEQPAFYYAFEGTLDLLASCSFHAANDTRSSHVAAVTRGTPLDALDTSAALDPQGRLHLAVSRERYQCLGLQGARSRFSPDRRYNITVECHGQQYLPTSQHAKRVQECLSQRLGRFRYARLPELARSPRPPEYLIAERATRRMLALRCDDHGSNQQLDFPAQVAASLEYHECSHEVEAVGFQA